MIPDKQWVERYRNRLRRYEHLRLDFLKTKTTELANKIVVDEIRSEMEKAGVHRKIWESVVVESVQVDSNTGSIKINIHHTLKSLNTYSILCFLYIIYTRSNETAIHLNQTKLMHLK